MGSLKIQASLDSKGVISGLKDIGKGLGNIEEEADAAARSLGKMLQDRNASTNYRKQLSQLQRTIQDLTITYRELSAEEKNSEFGKTLKGRIDEMTDTASRWKDAITDVQTTIQRGASDTLYWDASLQGISLVTSAAQTLSGVIGLTTGDTQKMIKAMTAIQTLQGVLTFAQQMQNALQGQSALMKVIIGLRNKMAASMGLEYGAAKKAAAAHIQEEMVQQRLIVTKNEAVLAENALLTAKERAVIQSRINTANIKLETLAREKEAVATVEMTAAQKALLAVKMAGPYVLIAAAVTAVTVALLKATKMQREMNKLQKEAGKNAGELIGQYKLLQIQYESLTSDEEKSRFFEKNKSALEDLVGPLEDVNELDRVFIEQQDKVIELLLKRSMVMAMQQKYTEAWSDVFDEYAKNMVKEGDVLKTGKLSKYGIDIEKEYGNMVTANGFGIRGNITTAVNPHATKETAEEVNKQMLKYLEENNPFIQWIKDALPEAMKELEEIEERMKRKKRGGDDDAIKAAEGSLADYKKRLNEVSAALENMSVDDEKYKETLVKKIELQKEYNAALDKTKKVARDLRNANYEPLPVVGKQITPSGVTSGLPKGETVMVRVGIDREQLRKEYNAALQSINTIKEDFSIGIIDQEQAQREIDAVNITLKKYGLGPIPVDIEVPNAKLEKLKDAISNIGTIGGIGNIYTSFRDLGEAIDDAKDGVEGFFTAFDTVIRGIQAAIGVVEAFTNVTKLMGKASKAAAADAATENAAVAANTGEHAANAVAKVFSSNAALGIAGIAVAAALAGLVIAQIAKAKKANFASGGIVPGNSFSGDKVIAGLNSGEMVLNKSQQKNLFDMLDHGASGSAGAGGQVEFEIRGEKLYGVLKNYEQKRKRV